MLGLLFTATVSNDVVKDLQDKVISLQDHEVAFLNTQISNIWATVGIAAGIIIALASGVLGFVSYSNNRAKKRMEEATGKMLEATEKLKDAEGKISELELKISEANQVVSQAQSIANIAQEKLAELEAEQKALKVSTILLSSSQKIDAMLIAVRIKLDFAKAEIYNHPNTNDHRVITFRGKYDELEREYIRIQAEIIHNVVNDKIQTTEQAEKVSVLSGKITKLFEEYDAFCEEIQDSHEE